MPRRPVDVPDTAEIVTTYDELEALVQSFAQGNLSLLVILGRPGLSKSQTLKRAIEETNAAYMKGRHSAIRFYAKLFYGRNCPVVLDDCDDMLSDRLTREYIKNLTETDTYKTLRWETATRLLDEWEVPSVFSTTSSTCIITNSWDSSDNICEALESRAEFVHFAPTWHEVYKQAGEWYWDQEIFDYLRERIPFLKSPDLRILVKAAQRKEANLANLNWRKVIDNHCDDEEGIALRLQLTTGKSINKTCEAWMQETGMSRATFFRRYNEIKRMGPLKPPRRIVLERTEKPVEDEPHHTYEDENYDIDHEGEDREGNVLRLA